MFDLFPCDPITIADPLLIYTAVVAVSRMRLRAWAEPFMGESHNALIEVITVTTHHFVAMGFAAKNSLE